MAPNVGTSEEAASDGKLEGTIEDTQDEDIEDGATEIGVEVGTATVGVATGATTGATPKFEQPHVMPTSLALVAIPHWVVSNKPPIAAWKS